MLSQSHFLSLNPSFLPLSSSKPSLSLLYHRFPTLPFPPSTLTLHISHPTKSSPTMISNSNLSNQSETVNLGIEHSELDRFAGLGNEIADAAGEVIRKYFRKSFDILDKEDFSPVTIADQLAEEAMVSIIQANFPSHAIFGEEKGWRCKEKIAEYVWVLDPIDGTKSFITGKPLFGTLIALLHRGKPENLVFPKVRFNENLNPMVLETDPGCCNLERALCDVIIILVQIVVRYVSLVIHVQFSEIFGIIDQPVLRERWIGINGRKTMLNGQEISTRSCAKLSQAYLYTTSPHLFNGDAEVAFARVRDKVKVPLYGCDCYAYALLASGFVDLVIESGLKPYDFLSLIPVIEGAGGVITDWKGHQLHWEVSSDSLPTSFDVLAAGDKQLHQQALDSLQWQ